MFLCVIVCLYQHINVLHEKAKLHDDSRLTVFVTLPTDSESAAFNARNTLFQSAIVYTVFIKAQHFGASTGKKGNPIPAFRVFKVAYPDRLYVRVNHHIQKTRVAANRQFFTSAKQSVA